jgi:CspA family cold shock protein
MGKDPPSTRGRVKFYRAEKGWGAISTPELPHDVWVLTIVGYRPFTEGQEVEFRYEDCWSAQDSWHYRATWARRVPPTAV